MLECNSITVDGFSLTNDTYMFTINNLFDLDNDVIGTDLYENGQYYDHTRRKPKTPLLEGFVKTKNVIDFIALRGKLLKKGLKQFVVNITGLGDLYFMAEVTNWSHGIGNFVVSCQLNTPDPYLYMLNPVSIALGSINGNALIFPFTFPIVFGSVGSEGTITNVGNCVSYPVITVVGTCSNFIITNTTTGESIYINASLNETDTLIIDNRPTNRGVFLNGINRMDLKTGLWISCNVGDNNFTFQRTTLEDKQHCTIELQSSFV